MPQRSLASRAVVAVTLTIGFYALAITIAGGLLVVAHLVQQRYSGILAGALSIVALIGAVVIIMSILPRFARFVPPGPRLEEHAQPELFALIREVAAAMGQRMPQEVYLVVEANAGVVQRGGIAGIGGRRMMFIGLALLQALTVAQLRAVIAHEMGHYHGGDTKLAPWIYNTREVILRTIINLVDAGPRFDFQIGRRQFILTLKQPFVWYGELFLRATQPISRAQERAADRLSAKVAGAQNAIDALLATRSGAFAFAYYWDNELLPVLANGFRPPIAAGFRQYMAVEGRRTALGEVVAQELRAAKTSPYDSHPPLRERILALGPPVAEMPAKSPLAATLLRDAGALEEALVRILFPKEMTAELQEIDWCDVPHKVYRRIWDQCVAEHADALRDLNVASVSNIAPWLPRFARRIGLTDPSDEEAAAKAEALLGCAVARRLVQDGWVCDGALRDQLTFTRNGLTMLPFLAIARLARGEMTPAAWAEECVAAGIAHQPLA